MSNEVRKVNIYNYESQSINEIDFFVDSSSLYTIYICKKNKGTKKIMTSNEIVKLLTGKQKFKMVAIHAEEKKEIYSILSHVSQVNGICSPLIEEVSGIMYFPQLTYSDMGFLKNLCEQKNLKDYKLRLVGRSKEKEFCCEAI